MSSCFRENRQLCVDWQTPASKIVEVCGKKEIKTACICANPDVKEECA